MTVYDTANDLARQIKESREYVEYKQMKDLINADPNKKKKVDDFEKLRYDTQVLTLQGGGSENPETKKKLEEMYLILVEDKEIKKYFDMEVRFNVMLADVNKIIGEAVKEVL